MNLSSSLECSGLNIILTFGSEKTAFPIEYTGKLCEINKKINERLNWELVDFTKQEPWSMNYAEGRNSMILDAGYLTLDAYDPH